MRHLLNALCRYTGLRHPRVNKLKLNGCPGPDKFSGLFKNVVNEISYPLSCIFNISMSTSSISAILKTAIITPIFTSDSPNEANNYCPISLICIASKIMETIIKDINDHLNESKLISRQQHGFLVRHSIIHN